MSDIDFWAETQRIIMANLPTVHRSNYVAPDVELVLDMENDFEPGCGGYDHPKQIRGHEDAPAAFLVIFGCGHSVLQCAGRVRYLHNFPLTLCGQCDYVGPTSTVRFIPLNGAS